VEAHGLRRFDEELCCSFSACVFATNSAGSKLRVKKKPPRSGDVVVVDVNNVLQMPKYAQTLRCPKQATILGMYGAINTIDTCSNHAI
jgi:hypothetical protein